VILTSAAFRARLLKEAEVSEVIQHALKGTTWPVGLFDSGIEANCWEKLYHSSQLASFQGDTGSGSDMLTNSLIDESFC
jgi:hypothetical protein